MVITSAEHWINRGRRRPGGFFMPLFLRKALHENHTTLQVPRWLCHSAASLSAHSHVSNSHPLRQPTSVTTVQRLEDWEPPNEETTSMPGHAPYPLAKRRPRAQTALPQPHQVWRQSLFSPRQPNMRRSLLINTEFHLIVSNSWPLLLQIWIRPWTSVTLT